MPIALALIFAVALLTTAMAVRPFLQGGQQSLKGKVAETHHDGTVVAPALLVSAGLFPITEVSFLASTPVLHAIRVTAIAPEHVRPPPVQ